MTFSTRCWGLCDGGRRSSRPVFFFSRARRRSAALIRLGISSRRHNTTVQWCSGSSHPSLLPPPSTSGPALPWRPTSATIDAAPITTVIHHISSFPRCTHSCMLLPFVMHPPSTAHACEAENSRRVTSPPQADRTCDTARSACA